MLSLGSTGGTIAKGWGKAGGPGRSSSLVPGHPYSGIGYRKCGGIMGADGGRWIVNVCGGLLCGREDCEEV